MELDYDNCTCTHSREEILRITSSPSEITDFHNYVNNIRVNTGID